MVASFKSYCNILLIQKTVYNVHVVRPSQNEQVDSYGSNKIWDAMHDKEKQTHFLLQLNQKLL